MKNKIFIISSLFFFGLTTAAFTNLKKADEKIENETTEGVVWNGEIPYVVTQSHVYSSNPSDEIHFSNQSISLNHIGDINTVWNSYRGDGTKIAIIDNSGTYHHEDFWVGSDCHISNKSAYFHSVIEGGYITDILREDVGEDFSNASVLDPGTPKDEHDCVHHGISVGATSAASISGYGTVGIAPNAEVIFLKTDMLLSSICRAIEYATNIGVDVINMSLGSPYSEAGAEYVQAYIDYAYNHGVIVCASAGNDNVSTKQIPAALDHVLGVGALERNSSSRKASYSNYNENDVGPFNVDVTAPGTVYTAKECIGGYNTYTEINGTSFSSPILAGAACLFKQKYPDANQDVFEAQLFSSCTDIGAPGWDTTFGNGALNVARLMEDTEEVVANPTTTKNQDSTDITWVDEIGWNFRTLHIYSLGYFNGYTAKDFENYLTLEFGPKIPRSSYTMESTTAGWSCNVENSINDYLINTGVSTNGSGVTYSIHLPWWITNGFYQFVNNSNWINDDNNYIFSGDTHYKHEIKSYIYGSGQVSTPNPTVATTYDFKAVFVNQVVYLNDSNTIYETLSSYKTCIYDKLDIPESYKVTGFSSSYWYIDSTLQTPYTKRFVREDITLYQVISELNSDFYFQKVNDNPVYVYESYLDRATNAVIEPLGAYPGTLMTNADGVNFLNYGLYKISFHGLSSVREGDSLILTTDNNQTVIDLDILLTAENSYVYYDFSDESYRNGTIYAEAAELVYDLNELRLSIEASQSIYSNSYCGVSKEQAASILARYAALSTEGKEAFESATIYTYATNNNVDMANVSTQQILLLLNKIATGSNNSSLNLSIFKNNAKVFTLISVLLLTSMLIAFAALRARARKNNY